MRSSKRYGGFIVFALSSLLASCTLGNTLDVCSRAPTKEHDLNAQTEGDQTLSSRNVMGPLPAGGAMVVWSSSASPGAPSEVRGGVTTADGSLQPTCDALDEFTYSLMGQNADQPVIAPPPANDELGVIAYRVLEPTRASIWVVPITPSGCLVPNQQAPRPFELSGNPDETAVSQPSVAYLGDRTFVVTWTQAPAGALRARLFARRFRLGGYGVAPQFLAIPNALEGQAGDAVAPGASHANATLVSLPDGAAMTYFNLGFGTQRLELVRFAPDLSLRWGPLLLRDDTQLTSGLLPELTRANLAWAPDTFLVGWLTGGTKQQPLIEGMFVDGSGHYLSSSRSPNGGPFRFGSAEGVVEASVSIAGLFDSGFIAAWAETGAIGHADHSGQGIRAIAFNTRGDPRFADRACDATDFQLNTLYDQDQTLPALSLQPDGSLMAAWVNNNNGGTAGDRSGLGLKIVDLTMKELLPLR